MWISEFGKASVIFAVGMFACLTAMSYAHIWDEILEVAKKTDEKAGRCVKSREIPPLKCKAQQDAMIESGCVKPEHVQFIRANGVFPLCNIDHEPASACFCGCFGKGTRVWVENLETGKFEMLPVENLVESPEHYRIATLTADSTLNKIKLEMQGIARVTRGPESKPLIVISVDNGAEISLSEEHAVLLASGRMVEAADVNEGDLLLDMDGAKRTVVKISQREADGDVYNLITNASALVQHVIVAEGLLMGDLRWQSSLPMENDELALQH